MREAFLDYEFWKAEAAPRAEELHHTQALAHEADDASVSLSDRVALTRLVADAQVRNLQAAHGELWSLAALEKAAGHPLDEK